MTKENTANKVSPMRFVQQVRQETKKVTWPTRQETTVTSIMVLIIAVIAAIFFLMADALISMLLKPILG
jgi:preprotein translocase subunit SecE